MSLDNNIEKLIEKYFNGDSSLEEEQQLQTFFQKEDVPVNLKQYQTQFRNLTDSGNIKWDSFTDEKLFGKLEAKLASEKSETKVVKMQSSINMTWVYRIAAAVALILVGYFSGNGFGSDDGVDELRKEMQQMKAMMFDQLGSSSASGRLQAVNNTFGIQEADDEILDALILRMIDDKNINVRLKAVESLARFNDEEKVRGALVDALTTVEEPAIQIALINVLVEFKEKSAIERMEKIIYGNESLKGVKDEARLGIFKLRDL
jgi:HEAT repeats